MNFDFPGETVLESPDPMPGGHLPKSQRFMAHIQKMLRNGVFTPLYCIVNYAILGNNIK